MSRSVRDVNHRHRNAAAARAVAAAALLRESRAGGSEEAELVAAAERQLISAVLDLWEILESPEPTEPVQASELVN